MSGLEPVVTGIGVVAPTGTGCAAWWPATCAGADGLRPIDRFDATGWPLRRAGQVADFDPVRAIDGRVRVQTDLFTQFALAAAGEALAQSGLTVGVPDAARVGVTTCASYGGSTFGQREMQGLWSTGPDLVGPYQSIAWFFAASTGQLSIRNRFTGPCGVVSAEAAGGLDALAHSRRTIRRGTAAVLTGGTEAPLSPMAVSFQIEAGLHPRDPDAGYLPFSVRADGYLPGEGGAMLVVEDPRYAADRGATPLARLAGHAATFAGRVGGDRPDRADWAATAEPLAAAIVGALRDAGCHPDDIDVVFADAAGLPAADAAEAGALHAALGRRAGRIPVTAPKAGTGRLSSGAAALDVAAAVLALRYQTIPATPAVDPGEVAVDLDLVTGAPRRARLRHALVLARGTGGFCSALVLRS